MALLALGLAVGGTSYAQSGDSKPSAKSSKKVSKKADKKSAKKKGKKTADVAVDTEVAGRINKSIVAAGSWADCQAVRKQLSAEILKQAKGKSDADLLKHFRKPANMLMLAQWVVADAELRGQEDVAKAGKTRAVQLAKASKELADLEALLPKGAKPTASLA